MGFFCGALSLGGSDTNFNELRRMCGMRGVGCAYVSREFSVIYAGDDKLFQKPLQPVTVSHNGHLYTAVVISAQYPPASSDLAREILWKYFEEGENCLSALDFQFSMLIYDGRCGELLACRSGGGDVPLFYVRKNGQIYFSTTPFPIYKLLGGCIRVSKRVLREYICSEMSIAPADLFCDIRSVCRGKGVFCTRFGESDIDVHTSEYLLTPQRSMIGIAPQKNYSGDIESVLTDTLFAFGYPQFDCYMPSFMTEARRAAEQGLRAVRLQDATFEASEYCAQRSYLLSGTCGARIISIEPHTALITKRAERAMEKRIDALLEPYLDDDSCVLYSVFEDQPIFDDNKKSTPLRIRKKGMLYQTVRWFECFNIVAE